MAYQPKFGPKKQEKKKLNIGFLLLGIVLVPVCTLLTVLLLKEMVVTVGRPKVPEVKGTDKNIEMLMDSYISGQIEDTRNSLLGLDKPVVGEEEKEEQIVRKKYWIEEGTMVAPEPNQELFGETDDPASLQWLLDEAEWILEGQELHFNTDIQIFDGSKVKYYFDDSIFAITWKEVHDGSVYTFSEVKITHPSQFRRFLAGGEYGSEMQYYPTEMAESVNAVVASAGDFYRFRNFGISVYEGEVRRVEGTYAETCYIDGNGNLHFTYGGEILDTPTAQAYVEENDIRFSLAFGPILVDNYEVVDHTWYGVGEITEGYARAALCQLGDLHYIVATANTEGPWQEIPTVKMFTKHIAATGCRMAYCLDGGQTATIVMNDELINRPVYGQQRKISDIIYFATAVPDGG